MILPITDKYRIKGDENQWMLQRYQPPTVKNPDGEWKSFKYFHDISEAVNFLGQMLIRTSDAQTLADGLVQIDRVTDTLRQALSPRFRVESRYTDDTQMMEYD